MSCEALVLLVLQLLLSHRMQAATMCEYTKQEFATGLRSLGYEGLPYSPARSLRSHLMLLRCLTSYGTNMDDHGVPSQVNSDFHEGQELTLLSCSLPPTSLQSGLGRRPSQRVAWLASRAGRRK